MWLNLFVLQWRDKAGQHDEKHRWAIVCLQQPSAQHLSSSIQASFGNLWQFTHIKYICSANGWRVKAPWTFSLVCTKENLKNVFLPENVLNVLVHPPPILLDKSMCPFNPPPFGLADSVCLKTTTHLWSVKKCGMCGQTVDFVIIFILWSCCTYLYICICPNIFTIFTLKHTPNPIERLGLNYLSIQKCLPQTSESFMFLII